MPLCQHLRNLRQLRHRPEFRDTLTDQLADVQALRTDAECRGWTDEAARHDRVAHALTDHLQRLDR
ncbi:putative transposase [Mycobacterium avium MAV_120809_2495]|nr:putative transposase [Mycobacterium avium MAV_120809_2495]